MTTSPDTCRSCGATVSGKFCGECGTPRGGVRCGGCDAELSGGARYCHRCGRPAGAQAGVGDPRGAAPGTAIATGTSVHPSDRTPWIAAALIIVVALGAIVWNVVRGDPQPAGTPPGTPAAVGGGGPGGVPAAAAPDISQMSPRERFDRLFNRIMTAAEQGDTATLVNFTPMALGAYAQLPSVDVDGRYHAAVINAQVGRYEAARALADTILAEVPGHLFGYLIRGEVARLEGDQAALQQARRDFAAAYDREMQANRVEYLEHRPVLERFRDESRAQ